MDFVCELINFYFLRICFAVVFAVCCVSQHQLQHLAHAIRNTAIASLVLRPLLNYICFFNVAITLCNCIF